MSPKWLDYVYCFVFLSFSVYLSQKSLAPRLVLYPVVVPRPIHKYIPIPTRAQWPGCDMINSWFGVENGIWKFERFFGMNIEVADSDWDHLYPEFRKRLKKVLDNTHKKTGVPWMLIEGYRSQKRQTWLWESGRKRPGPIITWTANPKYHGTGLAADCYPMSGINAPLKLYVIYRECYKAEGLDNPVWDKGDYGHVQLSNPIIRGKAMLWVKRGFR